MWTLTAGAAVVALAAAGLAVAMPTGPEAPVAGSAPPAPQAPAGWWPDAPGPLQDVLPPPAPAALRAAEAAAWVDARLQAAPAQDEPWAAIDECVRVDMLGDPDDPDDNTPAASIAVAVDGVIAYTKGYGVRDKEAGGEVDADTLFRIGSTTKMMTAAAIMQLREEGLLELDEPLTAYLPEFQLGRPWSADDLTLHLLMSHQSGLPDQYFVPDVNTPLMEWVQAVGAYSLPLYAAPGSFWNYGNPNFSLAGAVVERLADMPYGQYMAERLWRPAGMPLTTLDPAAVAATDNYATGYHGNQALGPADVQWPILEPAGGAFSTPTELVRWALALQNGDDDVLTDEAKMMMQERHVSMGYLPWMDYGYGVMVTDFMDAEDPETLVTVYDHGGNIYGGSSQLLWVPERGVVVSVLANTIRSLDYAAACAVRALADVRPIPPDSTMTEPEQWDAFTGTYSLLDVFLWPWTGQVSRVTDTLRMAFPDIAGSPMLTGPEMPFQYAFADLFVPRAPSMLVPSGVDLSFVRDPADPSRVRYMRNRNLVGQRVGRFPERIGIEGEACAALQVTAELDMPLLSILLSGLVTTTHLTDVPIAAGNPGNPSTASIKLELPGDADGADMVYVLARTAPTDALALYLLADLNGDGAFEPDDGEVVARSADDYGTSLLYAPGPLPGGDYQLWVVGQVVRGAEGAADLDITVMRGNNLRLENRPRGLSDGTTWRMEVCADNVADMAEPRLGMVQFSYGSPPRLFRVMVDWQPGQSPPWVQPTVYLPYARTGAE